MNGRDLAKASIRGAMALAVTPAVWSFRVRARCIGSDRALLGSTQALGLVPGLLGQYLRRAFLSRVLAHCAPSVLVEWGTLFSAVGTRLDEHVYIGPNCHIGLAHLAHDVLVGPGVHIPSGGRTHGTADSATPIREQEGAHRCVEIGANCWIGGAAVVMADVGAGTIVGAGAVVTRPLPPQVVAAGVPAKVVRSRATSADTARPS